MAVGTQLTIDDREFEIDRVNTEWNTVSLWDISFQNGTGFPIFRSESIQFVREVLAAQEEKKQLHELVSDRLSESGWTVTDELISNGIRDYHAGGGKGNDEEIADFIQDEFLSTEAEPELSARTLASSVLEDNEPVQDVSPAEETIPAPPKARWERIYFTDLHPEIPREQRHDFRITDTELGNGTPSEKFDANIAAIRTLKQIAAIIKTNGSFMIIFSERRWIRCVPAALWHSRERWTRKILLSANTLPRELT